MKSNRQIGLDGRVFITDCLSDGIFFIYSIIFSGFLFAMGDIMKLLGRSSQGMDALTNALVICDLVCSLSMIIVTYYVYFMHCGENIPKLGTKPLIYLEYLRLAYYGVLAYEVLYRFAGDLQNRSVVSAAVPVFYFFYFAWIICCICAAMFILTVLHQNVIRRSYSQSFKILALAGLGINVVLPIAYFITRIWVRGWGDGFYSAGLCDFVRFALAPIFYGAVWFLFMSAIDQVDRVFAEVDNAIRDRRYSIEFEDESDKDKKAPKKKKHSVKKKFGGTKGIKFAKSSGDNALKYKKSKSKSNSEVPKPEDVKVDVQTDIVENKVTEDEVDKEINIDDIIKSVALTAEFENAAETEKTVEPVEHAETEENAETLETVEAELPESEEPQIEDKGAKRVKPKKKHRITEVEEESVKVKASVKSEEEIAAEISESSDYDEDGQDQDNE